ncbi:MAG: small subunit ribosomal protein S6 [Rickettsiales bacterium]|jgi:small subunit ribosomal protein S6
MALYEVVSIARQDFSAEDVDNLSDKFSKIITDNKGKVISKEYWGLRDLAYKINKNNRGHYVLLNIESEFEAIEELKRVIGFDENIIRSNIFKVKQHSTGSLLKVSKDAKEYKAGNIIAQEPSEIDDKIDKIVINNLI